LRSENLSQESQLSSLNQKLKEEKAINSSMLEKLEFAEDKLESLVSQHETLLSDLQIQLELALEKKLDLEQDMADLTRELDLTRHDLHLSQRLSSHETARREHAEHNLNRAGTLIRALREILMKKIKRVNGYEQALNDVLASREFNELGLEEIIEE